MPDLFHLALWLGGFVCGVGAIVFFRLIRTDRSGDWDEWDGQYKEAEKFVGDQVNHDDT